MITIEKRRYKTQSEQREYLHDCHFSDLVEIIRNTVSMEEREEVLELPTNEIIEYIIDNDLYYKYFTI